MANDKLENLTKNIQQKWYLFRKEESISACWPTSASRRLPNSNFPKFCLFIYFTAMLIFFSCLLLLPSSYSTNTEAVYVCVCVCVNASVRRTDNVHFRTLSHCKEMFHYIFIFSIGLFVSVSNQIIW